MPNALGREVLAFAPVVGVVPSHGCEGEARIRHARVRGDVREDLRLAGGPPLPGNAWRRGMQRSRRMPCGVHSGARAQMRGRRWMILSPQARAFAFKDTAAQHGPAGFGARQGSLPTSVKTQVSGRGCVAVCRPRSGTLELRRSAATSSRCETTLRPIIADEHASCMEWPVRDSDVVHLMRDVQQMWAPTRRNTWQGTERVSVHQAQCSSSAWQPSTSFLTPEFAVLWSEPVRGDSHNRSASAADARRARVMLVVNPCALGRPGC